MKNKPNRGFNVLIGKTIKNIDASSVNVVHITTECGLIVSVDADESHYGIPVVTASEYVWKVGK